MADRPGAVATFKFGIIAGELKGRQISAPKLGGTRPPLTRLRRSIFDFLNPYLPGARYLDLYCGTGSYLFEAVSRGAERAVGVDLESALVESITRQGNAFGIGARIRGITGNVFEVIPRLHRTGNLFDIIMMAPPQYKGLIPRTLMSLVENPIATQGAIILLQHDTSETKGLRTTPFETLQSRVYGNTTFTILNGELPREGSAESKQ